MKLFSALFGGISSFFGVLFGGLIDAITGKSGTVNEAPPAPAATAPAVAAPTPTPPAVKADAVSASDAAAPAVAVDASPDAKPEPVTAPSLKAVFASEQQITVRPNRRPGPSMTSFMDMAKDMSSSRPA